MKSEKYKNFVAVLIEGRKVPLTAPAGKVTELTASKYARHWLKVQKGITGVDIVQVFGFNIYMIMAKFPTWRTLSKEKRANIDVLAHFAGWIYDQLSPLSAARQKRRRFARHWGI